MSVSHPKGIIMRLLLTLLALSVVACSSDAVVTTPEVPAEAQVGAPELPQNNPRLASCLALARIAKSAAEFRDQGITSEDFYQRITRDTNPTPAMAAGLKEVTRFAYDSGLAPKDAHDLILAVCVGGE